MTQRTTGSTSPFGVRLRQWRRQRGLSQLELAGRVASTSRHLSFLETGRSRPSRQMVLRLCDSLDVPLRERNDLLRAAGLAAAYPHADLDGPDLAPFRAAIDQLLAAHEPYPALVVGPRWDVVAANAAARRLYGRDIEGSNLVRRYIVDPAAGDVIDNWSAVAWATLARLRQQSAHDPFDAGLSELVSDTERALASVPRPDDPAPGLVVCPQFRVGDRIVRTISLVARFDPVAEITLEGLRVELTYPQDETAERFFRELDPAWSADGGAARDLA